MIPPIRWLPAWRYPEMQYRPTGGTQGIRHDDERRANGRTQAWPWACAKLCAYPPPAALERDIQDSGACADEVVEREMNGQDFITFDEPTPAAGDFLRNGAAITRKTWLRAVWASPGFIEQDQP